MSLQWVQEWEGRSATIRLRVSGLRASGSMGFKVVGVV